jgi:hypothetical protein
MFYFNVHICSNRFDNDWHSWIIFSDGTHQRLSIELILWFIVLCWEVMRITVGATIIKKKYKDLPMLYWYHNLAFRTVLKFSIAYKLSTIITDFICIGFLDYSAISLVLVSHTNIFKIGHFTKSLKRKGHTVHGL